MLGIFIINGVYPFGDESFMHSDMYHQYVPFLAEMQRRLKEHESLLYSWNVGCGSNFPALYAYYMASPFNWLVMLVPEKYLIEFMSYLVIFKIGLCGFTFSRYLAGHFNTKSPVIIPFAVLYALSGYLAAYNWNVMWLDCLFLFPLIVLGLEAMVKEGRFRLYCTGLALCILSNYYISIMICLFLVLYFLYLVFTEKLSGKRLFVPAGRFCLYSLLAGGMTAVLLIPELAALHLTEFSEFRFPDSLSFYFSVFDMLARHCVNVAVETGLDHWPNLYCGAVILMLVPLYLSNSRIPLREKAGRMALAAFLLISFSSNVLNFIWHGLNYPDSLPCRQSFLYIFLLLVLGAEACLRIRECSPRALGISFCLSLGAVVLFEKLAANQETFPTESFLLTALFLCVYAILLFQMQRPQTAGKNLRILSFLLIFVISAEAAVNMANTSCSVTSRSRYLENLNNYTVLAKRTWERDDSFYRFEKFTRTTKNDGTLAGYPTASLFSSTSNGRVQEFYDKMGMSSSKVFYCFEGATPLTGALLNVKYMFSQSPQEDPDLYTLIDQEGEIYLYECNYALPLGFILPDTHGDMSGYVLGSEASNPLETQNRMAYTLGLGEDLFEGTAVETDGTATRITVKESGHYYAFVGNSSVDTLEMESEAGSRTYTKLKYHYICDLGRHEAGDVITLRSEDSSSLELSVCRLNADGLERVLSALNEQTLTLDSYDSTHVSGHIQVEKAGDLVLGIPWEPGWTILVDGQEVEAGLFGDAFISLSLEEGEHTLSMYYVPQGLYAGMAVSLLCLAAFLLILFFDRKKASVRKAVNRS